MKSKLRKKNTHTHTKLGRGIGMIYIENDSIIPATMMKINEEQFEGL